MVQTPEDSQEYYTISSSAAGFIVECPTDHGGERRYLAFAGSTVVQRSTPYTFLTFGAAMFASNEWQQRERAKGA